MSSWKNPWVWATAWKDTRKHRAKLFVFTLSITLGVATISCISALSKLLSDSVSKESKSLLGADLLISERYQFSDSLFNTSTHLSEDSSTTVTRQVRFNSMAFFPKQDEVGLTQINATSSFYPFYGEVESYPEESYDSLSSSNNPAIALVDETIFIQRSMQLGDTVIIGSMKFRIIGYIKHISGDSPFSSLAYPRIYIPFESAEKTGLLQYGSLVSYRTFFKFDDESQRLSTTEKLINDFSSNDYYIVGPEDRAESTRNPVQNLYRFFSLIGLIAILLGVIGIGNSLYTYLQSKNNVISSLKCLGATPNQIFSIYFIQCFFIGLIGSSIGCVLGMIGYNIVGWEIVQFLNQTSLSFYPLKILQGLGLGVLFSMLFSIPPLLYARHISPLQAIQSYVNTSQSKKNILYYTIIFLFFLLIIFIYAYSNIFEGKKSAIYSIWFTLGLAAVIGLFGIVAKATISLSRFFAPKIKSYPLRQGILNLNRPKNQTLSFLTAIGFGFFLLSIIFFLQKNISYELKSIKQGNSPNLILIDIQTYQKESLDSLLSKLDLPILQVTPIVTMRLSRVKGESVSEILKRDTLASRAYTWEFRSTYRDTLFSNESILEGTFPSRYFDENLTGVSISTFLSESIEVSIGDTIVFDVQGVHIKSVVESIREIDFKRIQVNFSFVFPKKTLQDAPRFFAYTTKGQTPEHSAKAQKEIFAAFPNISIFDLRYIIKTFENLLDNGILMTQMISLICLITGFLVLASGLLNSQFQRIKENTLLQTLGCSSSRLSVISLSEFFCYGFLSSLVGSFLSIFATILICEQVFLIDFRLSVKEIIFNCILIVIVASIIVAAFSMILTVKTLRHSPLETLRYEN